MKIQVKYKFHHDFHVVYRLQHWPPAESAFAAFCFCFLDKKNSEIKELTVQSLCLIERQQQQHLEVIDTNEGPVLQNLFEGILQYHILCMCLLRQQSHLSESIFCWKN
jgi:hypothetical protein